MLLLLGPGGIVLSLILVWFVGSLWCVSWLRSRGPRMALGRVGFPVPFGALLIAGTPFGPPLAWWLFRRENDAGTATLIALWTALSATITVLSAGVAMLMSLARL